jgi:hypothetical protein
MDEAVCRLVHIARISGEEDRDIAASRLTECFTFLYLMAGSAFVYILVMARKAEIGRQSIGAVRRMHFMAIGAVYGRMLVVDGEVVGVHGFALRVRAHLHVGRCCNELRLVMAAQANR